MASVQYIFIEVYQIESIKTTSMESVSAGVLDKIKNNI